MNKEQENSQNAIIDQLQNELNRVNAKLKESEAYKSHFLSSITNEIINPFTSIIGLSQNIQRLKADRIGQIYSIANLIYHEAFDLDFQLKNIFEAAKIEAGETQMDWTNANLVQIIDEEVERFRFQAEKKSLYFNYTFDKESPIRINIDVYKFKSIISNLLSNSIKFSNEKQKIDIHLKKKPNGIVCSIQNTGKTLNNEEIKNIYDRFFKLNTNIHSLNTGNGLGLSIVWSYIELLNGHIHIESENNQTKFIIEIPDPEIELLMGESNDINLSEDVELF